MKIIFLDVDGVLNDDYTSITIVDNYTFVDDIKVERLAHIVKETDAKIVLSSTWRMGKPRYATRTLAACYDLLASKLLEFGLEIYDVTDIHSKRRLRGDEIDDWLESHKDLDIENYIILDDESDSVLESKGQRFMKINPVHGLTDNDASAAILVLNYL